MVYDSMTFNILFIYFVCRLIFNEALRFGSRLCFRLQVENIYTGIPLRAILRRWTKYYASLEIRR